MSDRISPLFRDVVLEDDHLRQRSAQDSSVTILEIGGQRPVGEYFFILPRSVGQDTL